MSRVYKVQRPRITRGLQTPNSTIIAVGGGKGGIGKSFFSSTLASVLAHHGMRTVLVDLDLGAANIHTWLGQPHPTRGVEDFVMSRSEHIEDLLLTTKIPNLRMLGGTDADRVNLADISVKGRSQLMSAIFNMDADYTILDLSAGTHNTTLDFFLMAEHKIMLMTPEPSSIENAYRFMKAAFFRRMRRYQKQCGVQRSLTNLLKDPEKAGARFPSDILLRLAEKKPEEAKEFMSNMMGLEFQLVLNQTRTHADRSLGPSIGSVVNKYFGLPAQYLGHLEYDNAVWRCLRKKSPLLLESPHSPLYAQMLGVVREMTGQQHLRRTG